jgi:hypothetical protein
VIADAFFGLIFACVIVAIVFALNVFSIFSLIQVAKANDGIVEATRDAWEMFSNHKAVALEMSAVLFGMNFLLTVAYVLGVVILAVPFLFLFGVAVTAGSLTAVSVIGVLFSLTLLTATICMGGFMTTFTLSAWTGLVYRLANAKTPVRARLHEHTATIFALR